MSHKLGVVDKFMGDVAGIWNKGAEQFAFSTVIAATTGYGNRHLALEHADHVPLDVDAENSPTEDADVTVPAISTQLKQWLLKTFAGIDRKIFSCAFLHPDVVAYLRIN